MNKHLIVTACEFPAAYCRVSRQNTISFSVDDKIPCCLQQGASIGDMTMVWFFIKNTLVITAVFCACMVNPMQILADQSPQDTVPVPQSVSAETVTGTDTAANSDVIKAKLSELGYTGEQIEQILSQLSDKDIEVISQNIDQLQSGGTTDPSGFTFVVIALLVYIFLNIVEGYDWP